MHANGTIQNTQSPSLTKYFYWMLLLYWIEAWFSEGYGHADEHYQILEFAAYYLHHYPYAYPWELTAQIRPTFQIWVVIGLYKIASVLAWQVSPFMLAFLTRAATGTLSAISCYAFVTAVQPQLNSEDKRKYLLLLSAFGYFAFACAVRFASETWSADFFLLGFGLLFHPKVTKNNLTYVGVGLCLGSAFIARYQTGFMIAGLLVWLCLVAKLKPFKFSMILLGLGLVGALGVCLDAWFYGKWVFTAWRYFDVNLLQDKVSDFGKSSIWTYLQVMVLLPYGGLFVLSGLVFMIKFPKHVLTWILIPFLLIHCLIGHKELRFLIPILGLMPFTMIYTFQELQANYPNGFKLGSVLLNERSISALLTRLNRPVWMLNGLVLGYLLCIARSDFGVYKYIWTHYHDTPVFLTYVQHGASVPDNAVLMSMPLRFYTPESVYIHKSKQFTQFSCQHPSTCLTWVSCSENLPKNHKNIKLVYDSCKIYDQFKPYLNVSHWMDRSVLFRRAKLYELSS